jgi:hypothetical protein
LLPSLDIGATPASNAPDAATELYWLREVILFDVPRDPHARAAISLAQIGGCQKLGWFVCSHEQTNRHVKSREQ